MHLDLVECLDVGGVSSLSFRALGGWLGCEGKRVSRLYVGTLGLGLVCLIVT